MTEPEWVSCTDPRPMLEFLEGKATDRKLRLFACACSRRIWNLLGEADRRAVEMAESYADGLVGNQGRRAAAKSPLIAHAAIFCTSVNMGEEIPYLGGSVATNSADSAAKVVAMKLLPSTVSPDGSVVYFRAVERLVRSERWQKAKEAEQLQQAALLRDIFGNPFRSVSIDPACLTPTILALAQAAYDDRLLPAATLDPDRLAVLADALEESGCTDAELLGHLRGPGPHYRGCWCLDLLRGQE